MYQGIKLSIIIPVHNSETTIERCVESIFVQSYKNIEIVIVENASKDSSLATVYRLSRDKDFIKVISVEEAGVSNARNIGMKYASGDIITFCDADDYYEGQVFEKAINEMLDSNADIVIFGFNQMSDDGFMMKRRVYRHSLPMTREEFVINVILDERVMGSVWNKLYRRSLFQGVYFDTALSMMEDTHFNVSVAIMNHDLKCTYINLAGYNYVVNLKSSSRSENKEKLFTGEKYKFIEALEKIEEDFGNVLSKREHRAVSAKKALLCSSVIWKMRNQVSYGDGAMRYERLCWLNKTFWSNYPAYLLSNHIVLKQKIAATVKNIIVWFKITAVC